MTEFKTENLVKFITDVPDDLFYIFDFSINEWIEAKITNQYPYNLFKFVLANGKDEINCVNSYRITKNLDTVPNNEEMHNLRIAHKNLLTDKIIFSKSDNISNKVFMKEDDMYFTCKIHIKCDIIPGVICAFNEYHYYEDTFFEVNVPEDIKEKNLKIITDICKKYDEKKRKENEIIQELPVIKESKNKYVGKIRDIRPYWKTLKFLSDEEITYNNLLKTSNPIKVNENEYNDFCKENIINKALTAIIANDNKIDWAYTSHNENIDKNLFVLENFDGFFDIKIFGATYAFLKTYYQEHKMELEKIDDYFTFVDITQDNPLFLPHKVGSQSKSEVHIYTDGEKISYNGIIINQFSKPIVKNCNENFIAGLFPSKKQIFLLGHFFLSSSSTIYNEDFE